MPRCGRCIQNGVLECSYDPMRRKRPGNVLAMGEACLPCRLVPFLLLDHGYGPSDADGIVPSSVRERRLDPSTSPTHGTEPSSLTIVWEEM